MIIKKLKVLKFLKKQKIIIKKLHFIKIIKKKKNPIKKEKKPLTDLRHILL